MKKLILLLIIFLGCQERTSLDCGGVWGGEGMLDECGICNGLDINNNGECDYHCFECTNIEYTNSDSCIAYNGQWLLNQTIQDECGVCYGIDNNNSGECDYDCSSCDDEISTDYVSCTQNDGVWSQMSIDECGVCNGIDNNNSGECDYDCSSCDDEISTDYISCTQNDGVWSQMSTDECGVCDTNSENDCSESCVVNYILWQDSYDLFINAQECLSYRNLISQIVISEECIFSYINNDNNETITIDQAYLDSIICEE